MEKLRLLECFSGLGFQRRGIELTGLYDVDVVGTSDIDTNAIIGYAAIHEGMNKEMVENYADYPSRNEMVDWLETHNIGYDPVKNKPYDWKKKVNSKKNDIEKAWLACKLSKNIGDISKVKTLQPCDMLTYSYPCTDISVAGKIQGFKKDSGTRSSLVHEIMRLLVDYKERNELPKYLLMENVKNLVSKKFIDDFNDIISLLDDIGYNTYWSIMNGKDCGVPQNRERVFGLSIRKDIDNGKFEFPQPFDNGMRLKDILIKDAPENYYINNEKSRKLIDDLIINGKINVGDDKGDNKIMLCGNITPADNEKIHQRNWVYDEKGVAPCETSTQYKDPSRVLMRFAD